MPRPSVVDVMMGVAKLYATRSTCASKHKVGAVIFTADYRILATGYNGVPEGMIPCDSGNALGLNCTLDSDGRCTRAMHAEARALLQCARLGISCEDAAMCTTHAPCERCAMLLIEAGITTIWHGPLTSSNGLSLLRGYCSTHRYTEE